ncbi:MAG: hypothetical protein JWR85_1927 [Marmoricola sp.]|nr:hypothetical protein [Marmoricola sp.]
MHLPSEQGFRDFGEANLPGAEHDAASDMEVATGQVAACETNLGIVQVCGAQTFNLVGWQ